MYVYIHGTDGMMVGARRFSLPFVPQANMWIMFSHDDEDASNVIEEITWDVQDREFILETPECGGPDEEATAGEIAEGFGKGWDWKFHPRRGITPPATASADPA